LGQHLPDHPGTAAQPDLPQQHAAMAAGFAEQRVRSAFMAKVLTLVFLQLATTIAMSVLFYYLEPLKLYVRENAWPFYMSWALSFACLITLSCSEKVRRVHPYNIIALGVFTLIFSFQIAAITSFYDTKAVISAFVVTAGIVLGCAVLAFSKIDFTKWYGIMGMVTWGFIITALLGIFFVRGNWTIIAISFFGALLFSAWLVIDLQMIMGGKGLSLGPDDWVFASIKIYLDIVQIFLYILQLFGAAQRN
jgi:FtsH-binding integral membrane protein